MFLNIVILISSLVKVEISSRVKDLRKALISISIAIVFIASFIIFATPLIKEDIKAEVDEISETEYAVFFKEVARPSVFDQLIIKIEAINTGRSDNQFASAYLLLPDQKHDFRLIIDGITHTYYIYPGKSLNYLEGPGFVSLALELPELDGIDFKVTGITFSRRIAYPVDIKSAQYLISAFGSETISSLIVSFYIGIFLILLIIPLFFFIFKPKKKIAKVISVSLLASLLVFSSLFYIRSVYVAKSYYDSFIDEISQGRIDEIYQGFYGFRKFIKWLGKKIPSGSDIVVFMRGSPVYLRSELAYNLYPRDIRFIDISGNDKMQVIDTLESLAREKRYIVLLTEKDKIFLKGLENDISFRIVFESKYREDAGYIFRMLP